jgi:7-alpha-hydroxysteroid dehydrogenase
MILDRFRVTDKVAIVTGASAGIGRRTALALAEAGADVVCAARTVDKLEELVGEIRALGRKGLAVRCDVKSPEQIETVVQRALGELGGIDIVVNNAGGTGPTPVLELSLQDFEAAFHFNVGSAFLLSKLSVPHMAKRGCGAIVNISSSMSFMVDSGFVAYGTAKAALSHMTRLMAYEFAPHVRVNALAVGATVTEALGYFLDAAPDIGEKMIALTPMARLGTPEDIALAALYLASPAAGYVTGTVLEIDGGAVASTWPIKMPSGL